MVGSGKRPNSSCLERRHGDSHPSMRRSRCESAEEVLPAQTPHREDGSRRAISENPALNARGEVATQINEVDPDDGTHYFGGRYEEEMETFKTKISLESEK